eukprot:6008570-Amphidinium_carterae.1
MVGELFRTDAKAEGDKIVLGGWETFRSRGGTRRARWFSMELNRKSAPWAHERGAPYRSIVSLELMATLVGLINCVLRRALEGSASQCIIRPGRDYR